ncbi:MAG: NfeD family protein [Ardenticatenaceae bacterium]|nr:NfeD family protein [Ardenticatenaceae bacterium]HBY98304.1 hypothetical protein [Chloroflexota bacterium]
MWCHLLLAAPLFGLVLFAVFPLPLALPLYSLVALGSLALYHRVWRSSKAQPMTGREGMLGAEAWATTDIDAQGYGLVRWSGELWAARSPDPVARGTPVRIIGFEGLRLVVQPTVSDGNGAG